MASDLKRYVSTKFDIVEYNVDEILDFINDLDYDVIYNEEKFIKTMLHKYDFESEIESEPLENTPLEFINAVYTYVISRSGGTGGTPGTGVIS